MTQVFSNTCCCLSINPLPINSSVIFYLFDQTLKLEPCELSHPHVVDLSASISQSVFTHPLSFILTHTHTLPPFPSWASVLRFFPPRSKVGLNCGRLTRLPETTKKERVLIGVTGRWKTGCVEIRAQCDANRGCIQWLHESPKGPLFSCSAIREREGITLYYSYVWWVTEAHTHTWTHFGEVWVEQVGCGIIQTSLWF